MTHPKVRSKLERDAILEDIATIAEAVFDFH